MDPGGYSLLRFSAPRLWVLAMAESPPDGAHFRQSARFYPGSRRKNSAASEDRVASLPGFGGYGRTLRGVPLPRLCHGGPVAGRIAGLGRCLGILSSLRVGASLSRQGWFGEHTGGRHSVRNGPNRVRWVGGSCDLAHGN